MYLLTFITLVIGLIGIYTEVLGLQTARIYASQKGIAQAMLTWHAGAVSMAASIIRTNTKYSTSYTASGCSLSSDTAAYPTGFPLCPSPQKSLTAVADNSILWVNPLDMGTVTNGNAILQVYDTSIAPSGAVETVHLPTTFNIANNTGYRFYSILYQNAGVDYVVTFVPPGTGNPPFLTLASGLTIGLTNADLFHQLQNTGVPHFTYGGVDSTGQNLQTAGIVFALPSLSGVSVVKANSAAVISSPDGF